MNNIFFAHAGHAHKNYDTINEGAVAIAIVGVMALVALATVMVLTFYSAKKDASNTAKKSASRKK